MIGPKAHSIFGDAEISVTPTVESDNHIYKWNTDALNKLFDVNWKESQLYGVLEDLGVDSGGYIIAGGCIVRHLMKTDIFKGDIDIFPKSEEEVNILVKKFEAKGYKLEKKKFSYEFEYKQGARKTKVQIVHHNPQSLSKRLEQFDFEHVRIAYSHGTFQSTMGATTAIAQRKLHLRYVREPNYSLLRALKYKGLGFDADRAITQLAVMINRGAKEVNAAEWEETNPIVEY